MNKILISRFAKIALPAFLSVSLCSCRAPVPVDVVMVDNELFFVLETEYKIGSIWVTEHNAGNGERDMKTMWVLRHDLTTEVKKRKYPKLKQIKYAQKFDEFTIATGPFKLQRNVEYMVEIEMGSKFASEIFIISNDNQALMPRPTFERQKRRVYSVLLDKNGNKILVAKPVPK
ncbi:MAG: hypothetical protein HY746_05290 [Elusimicrobia bacterium]|nr:hypothetical protein [Elusimicrobiota bacterium]